MPVALRFLCARLHCLVYPVPNQMLATLFGMHVLHGLFFFVGHHGCCPGCTFSVLALLWHFPYLLSHQRCRRQWPVCVQYFHWPHTPLKLCHQFSAWSRSRFQRRSSRLKRWQCESLIWWGRATWWPLFKCALVVLPGGLHCCLWDDFITWATNSLIQCVIFCFIYAFSMCKWLTYCNTWINV